MTNEREGCLFTFYIYVNDQISIKNAIEKIISEKIE
jgi:hypothetical protein